MSYTPESSQQLAEWCEETSYFPSKYQKQYPNFQNAKYERDGRSGDPFYIEPNTQKQWYTGNNRNSINFGQSNKDHRGNSEIARNPGLKLNI